MIVHYLIMIMEKITFLHQLGEGPIDGINGSTGAVEKKLSIDFSKAKTKFCLSLQCNGDESYLYANKRGTGKFEPNYNIC